MVPFGVSMAATVRVGHAAGRRDVEGTRRAGMVAIALGAGFMAGMTLIVVLARNVIPLLFLGIGTADTNATLQLAAILLVVGATFFIADGVQTVAAGAFRGLNDTRMPLLFAAICFWAIGFVACYAFGFTLGVWRNRYLGRSVDRACALCTAADLALPFAHQARLSSRHHHRRLKGQVVDRAPRHRTARPPRRRRGGHVVWAVVTCPIRCRANWSRSRTFQAIPIAAICCAIETASPERIEPFCPHFGICGGCAIQHWTPARYREWKHGLVVDALAQAGLEAPVDELIDAHGDGRRRATFHARRGTHGVIEVGFAALRAHHIVGIDRCPVLAPSLDGAIAAAWAVAEALRRRTSRSISR